MFLPSPMPGEPRRDTYFARSPGGIVRAATWHLEVDGRILCGTSVPWWADRVSAVTAERMRHDRACPDCDRQARALR